MADCDGASTFKLFRVGSLPTQCVSHVLAASLGAEQVAERLSYRLSGPSLDQLASESRGSAGAWIDPSTANARRAHLHHLPGVSVVAQLRACVDEPAAVCITSQPDPDSAVLACHVVGGLDRRTGEVVGFVLARIWT